MWLKDEYEDAIRGETQGGSEKDDGISTIETEVLSDSSPHYSHDEELLPPKRTFAASQEDVTQAERERMSLPGSTSQQPGDDSSAGSRTGNQTSGQSDHSGVAAEVIRWDSTTKEVRSGRHESSPRRQLHSRMGSKGNLVLQSTIPENELECASLSTIEKAEVLAEQTAKQAERTKEQGKSSSLQPPRGLKPAISSSVLSQGPSSAGIGVKRTRSNTDIPGHSKPTKQTSLSKIKTRVVPSKAVKPGSHQQTPYDYSNTGGQHRPSTQGTRGRVSVPSSRSDKKSLSHHKSDEGVRSPKSPLSPQTSSGSLKTSRIVSEGNNTVLWLDDCKLRYPSYIVANVY